MLHYEIIWENLICLVQKGPHIHFNIIWLFSLGIHNFIVANVISLFLKKEILRHMAIHTGKKPDPCTKCGKAFSQKVNLKYHMTIHCIKFFSWGKKKKNLWIFTLGRYHFIVANVISPFHKNLDTIEPIWKFIVRKCHTNAVSLYGFWDK